MKELFRNTSAADRSTSRIINQKTLIDHIYKLDGVSKATLANELGLSKPAVSKNVAELISMGIVEERGEGEASRNGGRKPIPLHINSSFRYIGALDFSLKEPVCAIGDLRCNLLGSNKIHISRESSSEDKKKYVSQIFKEMFRELNLPIEKLGIIIISYPGIIGTNNIIHYTDARHHPWTEIGLADYLGREFNVPVILENDVRLAAIGEMEFGPDNTLQDLIYVTCGIGLGAGFIVKGKPYEGCNRADGELGAFLHSDGRRLEDVVTMDGLLKRVSQICAANGKVQTDFTFEEIVELAKAGDECVCLGIREVGQILGNHLYNCSVLLDIRTVILGGDYLSLGGILLECLEETMNRPFLPFRTKLIQSRLEGIAGILGGFVLGKEEVIRAQLLIG